MKLIRLFIVAGLLLALAVPALAASAESPIHLNNRLRIGYDDNIYQEDDDPALGRDPNSSLRIVEELEMMVNLNMERTYLGLRYRPSLLWYADREPDKTDFLHYLDLNLTHNFNPILALSIADTLRAGQLPELQDDGFVVRQKDDNYHNSALATLSYNIQPETRLDLSGRFITLTYNTDSPAKDNSDYYSLVGGVSLRQQLASRTTVMGDLRYQTLTYDEAATENNRDATTLFAGLGLEQSFNPQVIANLRAGMERRDYDNENFDDKTQPYGELSMTFLPTAASRFTAAGSYTIYESDVEEYLSQDRAYLSLSFAHDFTSKLSLYMSGAYALSAYEADYALASDDPTIEIADGDEKAYMISARLTYRINRINWLEAGWQYTNFDTDVLNRESYKRNRIDIGWKIQLF